LAALGLGLLSRPPVQQRVTNENLGKDRPFGSNFYLERERETSLCCLLLSSSPCNDLIIDEAKGRRFVTSNKPTNQPKGENGTVRLQFSAERDDLF